MTIEAKKEYQFSGGFGTSLDVKKVVAELLSIQREEGDINPEIIVKNARRTDSALHHYFEWNNTKAANQFRLQQATLLLQRIEVKTIKDGEPVTLRAFEITSREVGDKSYISFNKADGLSRSKEIALNDLKRSLNRLTPYEQFQPIIPIIKKAIKELSKVSTETKKQPVEPVLAV